MALAVPIRSIKSALALATEGRNSGFLAKYSLFPQPVRPCPFKPRNVSSEFEVYRLRLTGIFHIRLPCPLSAFHGLCAHAPPYGECRSLPTGDGDSFSWNRRSPPLRIGQQHVQKWTLQSKTEQPSTSPGSQGHLNSLYFQLIPAFRLWRLKCNSPRIKMHPLARIASSEPGTPKEVEKWKT